MHHVVKSLIFIIFFYSFQLYAYIPSEGNVTASYGPFLYKTNFSGSKELAESPVLGDFGFVTNGDLNVYILYFHQNEVTYSIIYFTN